MKERKENNYFSEKKVWHTISKDNYFPRETKWGTISKHTIQLFSEKKSVARKASTQKKQENAKKAKTVEATIIRRRLAERGVDKRK